MFKKSRKTNILKSNNKKRHININDWTYHNGREALDATEACAN